MQDRTAEIATRALAELDGYDVSLTDVERILREELGAKESTIGTEVR